ncbi:hypothetical protein C7382_11821 [Porphyromonas loveana]|uniref:Uncharacterized protein n=2 Tax=Porphyromonas loveana TaxID=1884669 RepID=A0A2U1F6M9_9PORP|nr:hypothetical protein C7382_11821 [Porphyromonas loveana]
MSYDNMYRIVKKKQDLRQANVQFAGQLSAGYELENALRYLMSDTICIQNRFTQ